MGIRGWVKRNKGENMPQGEEIKTTIEIKPNKQLLDADYIFETLIYRIRLAEGEKRSIVPYQANAKKIFEKMCLRGGLHDSEWENVMNELGMKQAEWQLLIRRLKKAGMIKKEKHIFRPNTTYLRHIENLANTLHRYLMDMGVKIS